MLRGLVSDPETRSDLRLWVYGGLPRYTRFDRQMWAKCGHGVAAVGAVLGQCGRPAIRSSRRLAARRGRSPAAGIADRRGYPQPPGWGETLMTSRAPSTSPNLTPSAPEWLTKA